MWAQEVEQTIAELDVVEACGWIEQCKPPHVICNSNWNGKPLRFTESAYVSSGDIFSLDIQPRTTFCEWDPRQHQMSGSPLATQDMEAAVLLQERRFHTKWAARGRDRFTRSPIAGLPPPGNPTPRTDEVRCLQERGSCRPIPTPCRAPGAGVPIKLAEHIPQESPKDQHIPVCTQHELAKILDFDPVAEALRSDWENLSELDPDVQEWISAVEKDPFDAHTVHIYTDGSANAEGAGWAFVIQADTPQEQVLVGYQLGSFAGHPWHSRMGPPTAYNAEIQALTAATWWILRFMKALGWRGDLHFHWDSTVAGGKATGAGDPGGELMRSLQLALESSIRPGRLHHTHIKAHAGHQLNEIADAAAKRAAHQNVSYHDGRMLERLLNGSVIKHEWLWYALQEAQTSMPHWDLEHGRFNASRATAPIRNWQTVAADMIRSRTNHVEQSHQRDYHVRVATYNALSSAHEDAELGDAEFAGRIELMRNAAEQTGLHLIGIQEARTKQGQIISTTHARFCSGSDNGIAGVELWVALRMPYRFETDQTARCFNPTDFVVQYASPRELFVHCVAPGFDCVLVVAHAPHNGEQSETREKWWGDFRQRVNALGPDKEVVVLLDANARLLPFGTESIGDLGEDREDKNSPFFQNFIESQQLFVPAAFASFHWGPMATWVHPNGRSTARLDYVALPLSWKTAEIWSGNEERFHSGHPGHDHTCTTVTIKWTMYDCLCTTKRARIDREAMLTKEGRETVAHILQEAPDEDWDLNASEHAAILAGFLRTRLEQAFPMKKRLKSCRTAGVTARELYQQLTTCKRRLRHAKQLYMHILLKGAFDVWADRAWHESQLRWATRLTLAKARIAKDTTRIARRLRKEFRAEKRTFLDGLVKEAAQMNVSDVFSALRSILPNKKSKSISRPLPQVKKLDGTLTTNKEDLEQRWNEHFSELEAGHTIGLQDLIYQTAARQQAQLKPSSQSLGELPTRQLLEAAFRKVRTRRAPGPDLVPSELLAIAPAEMARIFYPLLLKFSLRLEEPVQWKGGTLVALHKDTTSVPAFGAFYYFPPSAKLCEPLFDKMLISRMRELAMHSNLEGKRGRQFCLVRKLSDIFWPGRNPLANQPQCCSAMLPAHSTKSCKSLP